MRILVGMSGGLDSTYAAYKLIKEGHVVEGAVLRMHEHTEIDMALESARSIGIPIHIVDCTSAFEECVVNNFISEYLKARTPNPCVICNSDVKFRCLLDYAIEKDFDAIATGHYARIVKKESGGAIRYSVSRSNDEKKDQTYMLWRLSQKILSHLIFPLADCKKSDVRDAARELGLCVADRSESQEICFVPSGDYAEFIEQRTGKAARGSFINKEGKVLGEHNGIIRYTVGQRKGLGIAMGERVFVTDINPNDNTVTLSPDDSYHSDLYISDMHFSGISEPNPNMAFELEVKIRYLAPRVNCVLEYLGEGRGVVRLSSPQRAVTPGQSAFFYIGDELIAGGFIDRK